MSGNTDELPADDSTRLRDRATSALQRRRQQASDVSSRLQDRATNAFQRRLQQREAFEDRVGEQRERFADALDLLPGEIEPRQLDDRGEEIGFEPTGSGRETLAERFAEYREFVGPEQTLVQSDPREGVDVQVDPDDIEQVAQEARAGVAADDEFTEPTDLQAEVGPGGVEDVTFTETGEQRRAGRQIESQTPLQDVGVDDVTAVGDGFELDQAANRRLNARRFEQQLDAFQRGELDPTSDLQATDDGFALGREPAREAAAEDIDERLPNVDVGPSDIELEQSDSGGFEAIFEREVRR